ncbi:hypothetical protein FHS89_002024 [Rubricella aquisinus]|uniref:Lipoprotein n=1 Tax=Rubricella aquisinus TaxID=2028108 RepID=A0A840WZV8_9RHOB|nr:hypothetical protein [Rubricella aquisinus]MBB5516004.1 hypothetical protein [Rubricella aquisinus]
MTATPYLSVAALAVTLAACAATRPDTAMPADMPALQEAFIGSGATSATLTTGSRGKFTFYRNGAAEFRPTGTTGNFVIGTQLASIEGNTVCLAPNDEGWTGACIDIYTVEPGSYFCEGRFGNAANWKDNCVFEVDG